MKKLFIGLLFIGSCISANAASTSWVAPNANGTYSTWSSSSTLPKYTLVDEATCNGNVDYVSTHTINARESYSIPLTSIPDGSTITAVYVAPCALQDAENAATSSLSMFTVVNGITSAYAGTYFLKGTTTPSAYSYAYIANAPIIKNASTKVEAGVVLVSGPVGGARLSRIAATIAYTVPAPVAPSNLVISRIATTTGITLSWKDNSNNESYFMLERSTNGTVYSQIATFAANTTKYSIPSLSTGTYYYRVRAYGAGGYSPYTNVASVTIAPVVTTPAAPTALGVSVASSTILLYWNDNSMNELGFTVEKSYDNGVTYKAYATTTNPYFVETDRTFGIYYYRVRAFNTSGYSAYTNSAPLSIESQLTAPSAITATLSDPAIQGKYAIITWTDNSTDETGFMIERSTNGITWTNIATTTYPNVMYFADSEATLTAGTYYYRVRAYNSLGFSAYSSSSAPVVVTPPAAPSALIAKLSDPTIPGKYIELSWTDNSTDETGFVIERSNNGTTWTHLATTTYASVPFFGDSEAVLTAGTYYYRVRAYNALGYSAYSSSSASVVVEDVPAPGSPAAPTTLQSYFASSTYFIYWFDNSVDELGFQIYKSYDGVTFGLYNASTTGPYFIETNTTPGTYYYKVRAYNQFGYSLFTNIVQMIIQ